MHDQASAIRLLLIALILVFGLSCTDGSPLTEPTASEQEAPEMAIVPGMEVGLVSTTGFGLLSRQEVDLEAPGGGTLVTVGDVELGEEVTIFWRRTIEQEIEAENPTPVTGVGTPTSTPITEIVVQEGTIVATGLDNAHDVLFPFYWQPGRTETDTSLIWLSEEAFSQLSQTRRTAWTPDVLTRVSQLPLEMVRDIEQKAEAEPFSLNAEPDFESYQLLLNGERVQLRAIRAYDDFGNAYIILADPRNPLILEFTFNAISTGVIGLDVGVWTLIKATFSGYRVREITMP
jgi:hypothetical protein